MISNYRYMYIDHCTCLYMYLPLDYCNFCVCCSKVSMSPITDCKDIRCSSRDDKECVQEDQERVRCMTLIHV